MRYSIIASDWVSTSPFDSSSAGTRACGLIGAKFRRVLAAAILCQMDRHRLILEALEIERYTHAVGGGRPEIGIEFHGLTPVCSRCNLAGTASVGDMGRKLRRSLGNFFERAIEWCSVGQSTVSSS